MIQVMCASHPFLWGNLVLLHFAFLPPFLLLPPHGQVPPISPCSTSSAVSATLGPQSTDQKKRKKKNNKRSKGQPVDSPESSTSMDPSAVAHYKADWEAYLIKEYGEYYYQAMRNDNL